MNRSNTLLLIAIALAVYGFYIASYVPALLVAPSPAALLTGFVLQVVFALAAALSVWQGARWATGAVVLLGVSVAGTWLVEAFVFGIVADLRALAIAGIAVIVTLIIAAYLNRPGPVLRDKG